MTDFKPAYDTTEPFYYQFFIYIYAIVSLLVKLKNTNGPSKLPLSNLAPARIPATQPVTTLWLKILVSSRLVLRENFLVYIFLLLQQVTLELHQLY